MYALCNVYDGQSAEALYERLFASTDEIREMMREIPGLVSYTLVKTENGGYSQIIVEKRETLADVGRIAGGYLKGLTGEIGPIDPPKSMIGAVGVHT